MRLYSAIDPKRTLFTLTAEKLGGRTPSLIELVLGRSVIGANLAISGTRIQVYGSLYKPALSRQGENLHENASTRRSGVLICSRHVCPRRTDPQSGWSELDDQTQRRCRNNHTLARAASRSFGGR